MRLLMLLCILFALLPLGILGHDLYLAYRDAEESHAQFGDKPLHFSDLGWLWIQYSPDTYDWARRSVDPDTWRKFIDPVLVQTALIATSIPAVLLAVLLIVLKIFSGIPFLSRIRLSGPEKRARSGIAIQGMDKSKGRGSYKRK